MAESDKFSPLKTVNWHELKKAAGACNTTTGHLRKIKDMVADVHKTLQKWESLNARGNSIISTIVNTKLEYIYRCNAENDEEEAGKTSVVDLSSKLDPNCEALQQVCQSMEGAVTKLTKLASTAKGIQSLCQHRGDAECVLNITWTVHQFVDTLETLQRMYAKELSLKTEIVKTVALAKTREMLMLFAAAWMHQPYLNSQKMVKILLLETGHQSDI